MGNAVTSLFEVKEQIGSGGPGTLWRVLAATKKSSGAPCSVFVYEKNHLEVVAMAKQGPQLRRDQEKIAEVLKREATTLARLRHPSMLEITEALDDSRTALAFATEPLTSVLCNVLGDFANFRNVNKSDFRNAFDLDEIEIQKGILQLVTGLEFLHANRIIHACLSPEAIYINAKGDWKIGGFAYHVSASAVAGPGGTTEVPQFLNYPPFCAPNLAFLAPEIVVEGKCGFAADGE
ncbi:kinase-like domain-containing protein [Blyttiomyces helicus]|uniref:Kinase-like domain-containing protein n=1 Tax=Blyttiomyces helicus TaxID=388810 RepID=A0A4P9WI87_9FUNG|nr:kinase-like domain-containing protein [Blyttiomyces helicus]|eukprot:RKO92122.1 kinase-like domain-containing protein [Blyttiomyces helicus]